MRGEYKFDPATWRVTGEMLKDYQELGFVLIRNMFNKEELAKVEKALSIMFQSEGILDKAYNVDDGMQCKSRLLLWNHPGNDVTGMIARCEKVVNTVETVMGGEEIYHYHTKVMMKEPFTGGSFAWHQDYGYWYKNGCLKPDMSTVFIALDKADTGNGCLQVIPGTHLCGRIEHVFVGGQTGADMERVEQIINFPGMKVIPIEMEPGDALIFHSNLLHKSDQNRSERRRWAFLCAYNRKDNNPAWEHHHPMYTPLKKVPDSAILDCTNFTDFSGKDIVDPKADKSVKHESVY